MSSTIQTLITFFFYFAVLLLLFMSIGLLAFSRRHNDRWYKEHGQSIRAQIISVGRNMKDPLRSNSGGDYITATWKDTRSDREYLFRRKSQVQPSRYQAGESIQVWIDPGNPGRYYMETS